jgi:F-type H+-transporting ATPase subunit epsilon
MANSYTLEVVTPERVMFTGQAVETIAPGSEGYLGILTGHMPLMTALNPGEVTVRMEDGRTTSHIVIGGGFLQVSPTKTTILADSAVRVDEIDVTAAEADLAEGRRMIAELTPGSSDFREAQRVINHAEAKIRSARGA